MVALFERARTRIPSLGHFVRRAANDRRAISYDLLPIATLPVRDALAGTIARFRPKTRDFTPSHHALALHRDLAADGLALDLPPVPAATVAAIRRYFETTPCRDPYRPHLGQFRYDAPPSPETNMGFFEPREIVAAPHLLRLFNDPDVLAAIELYLGCKPMLDNIAGWWSFDGRMAAKGTQRFHRDLDSLRGVKIFFYLTDVDDASGPHVYMKGSHRSRDLDTGKAQTDAAIHDAFGHANEVVVTGAAGTRFLADTFGYHKGLLPTGGARLMVSAQYNVNRSPHLPPRPFATADAAGLDRFVNRLVLR